MSEAHNGADASAPARRGAAVTPADATVLAPTRGLYVGGTGNLVVKGVDGNTYTIANAAVGYHPLQVTAVMVATTATSIVALY